LVRARKGRNGRRSSALLGRAFSCRESPLGRLPGFSGRGARRDQGTTCKRLGSCADNHRPNATPVRMANCANTQEGISNASGAARICSAASNDAMGENVDNILFLSRVAGSPQLPINCPAEIGTRTYYMPQVWRIPSRRDTSSSRKIWLATTMLCSTSYSAISAPATRARTWARD